MKVSVSASEPQILREAREGDLFLVHTVAFGECVCAVASTDPVPGNPAALRIVVIGCRLVIGEVGYRHTGSSECLHPDTPITLLDQVEPASFRQRTHGNDQLWSSRDKARAEAAYASRP